MKYVAFAAVGAILMTLSLVIHLSDRPLAAPDGPDASVTSPVTHRTAEPFPTGGMSEAPLPDGEPERPEPQRVQAPDGGALQVVPMLSHGALPPRAIDDVFLEVQLNGTEIRPERRPPLNISLVVDTSGSMRGDAMAQARDASRRFVMELEPMDRVSLVSFDSQSRVLVPSTYVDDAGRARLLAAVETLQATGMTALSDGLRDGARQVSAHASDRTVDRVVLMTDGIPNVGITSSAALLEKTRRLRSEGVFMSALGFSTDYDQELMSAMAREGAGNYRYIQNASDFNDAFAAEIRDLFSTAASQVALDVTVPRGVRIEEAYGYRLERTDTGARIFVGDIGSDVRRSVVLRLSVADHNTVTTSEIAQVSFSYLDRVREAPVEGTRTVSAERVDTDAQVREAINQDVIGRVLDVQTHQALARAMTNFNTQGRGAAQQDIQGVRQNIERAERSYGMAPARSRALQDAVEEVAADVANTAPRSPEAMQRSYRRSEAAVEFIR